MAVDDLNRALTVVRRTAVVLPLVLLSSLLTASVAGMGRVADAGGPAPAHAAPRPPAVAVTPPAAEVTTPASVARLGRATAARGSGTLAPVASVSAIPVVALAAYQRAAAVIGAADADCHLPWELVAAIGRVESDHGRVGGGALGADGTADPAIVGVPLDGRRGTVLVSDTDAGRYDGDRTFDRAVGPLQFIPATWGVVGVDADGDGIRDPQDVDDAALAAAVYLCSGDLDLAEPASLSRAVRRYNDSARYLGLVLGFLRSYRSGVAAPMPTGVVAAGVPAVRTPAATRAGSGTLRQGDRAPGAAGVDEPRPPASPGATSGPAPVPAPGPAPVPAPGPAPEPGAAAPLTTLLTRTQAELECTLRGVLPLVQPAAHQACVEALVTR